MNKTVKFLLVISVLLVSFLNVSSHKLSAKTLNDLYAELATLEDEVSNTQSSIDSTTESIESNRQAIEDATQDIADKQDEIDNNQDEIYALEDEKDAKDEDIRDLLVYYQTNNTVNAELEFFFNADSLTDSIHRENTVDFLTGKSNDKINEFIDIQEDLTLKNEELATDIDDLVQMQADFEAQIAEYELSLNDLNQYKVGAAEKVTDMKNTISYYEGLGCKADEDLEACKERTSTVVPNSSGFVSPMEAGYITSNFGWRGGGYHAGLDMAGSNTTIYAAAPGIVGARGYDGSRGNYVYIHHTINGQRYSTAYFHMSGGAYVSIGQQVTTTTALGNMGNTGYSFGAHLHFEILVNWYGLTGYNSSLARNPRNYLSYPAVGQYWSGRNR